MDMDWGIRNVISCFPAVVFLGLYFLPILRVLGLLPSDDILVELVGHNNLQGSNSVSNHTFILQLLAICRLRLVFSFKKSDGRPIKDVLIQVKI